MANTIKRTRDYAAFGPDGAMMLAGQRVDGRTALGKRYKAIFAEMVSDIGGEPTAAQEAIIRRASALAVQSEQWEAVMAQGGDVDVSTYCKLVNTLSRVLQTIGLQRHARDITPRVIDQHAAAVMALDGDE